MLDVQVKIVVNERLSTEEERLLKVFYPNCEIVVDITYKKEDK